MTLKLYHTLNSEIELGKIERLNFELPLFDSFFEFNIDSFFNRIDNFTDSKFFLFENVRNESILALKEELTKLKRELNINRSKAICFRIVQILNEIKAISNDLITIHRTAIQFAKSIVKSLQTRNKRQHFRNIFQFIFKNLDDESDSVKINYVRILTFSNLLIRYNELQRESYK